MTMRVKLCASYYPLNGVLMAFKVNIISIRKCVVGMDVVIDVTHTHQHVITHMVIRFL